MLMVVAPKIRRIRKFIPGDFEGEGSVRKITKLPAGANVIKIPQYFTGLPYF
jgi:hypothetical protein